MPASKAQQKAVTKYVKEKYDRFGLTMPKGKLDTIKAHAAARGESVNAFIGRAIDTQMDRDGGNME
jgi:predicted DNA binding CopG/RHH family protein